MIWSESEGLRNLQQVLSENGMETDLEGWGLYSALDVSADGRHIVGTGYNPSGTLEAFLVRLDAPISGRPNSDFDADGDVDGDDFLLWQASYVTNTGGDADGDGDTDGDDFLIWQAEYGGGRTGGDLAGVTIPEPTSMTLVTVLAAIGRLSQHRRRLEHRLCVVRYASL